MQRCTRIVTRGNTIQNKNTNTNAVASVTAATLQWEEISHTQKLKRVFWIVPLMLLRH